MLATNVENLIEGSYYSEILSFDAAENDVIIMDYSVAYKPTDTLAIKSGTLRMSVLAGGDVVIDDEAFLNEDVSITGLYTITFSALYDSGFVYMQYVHDFPDDNVFFRVNVKKWNSFIL